MLSLTAKLIYIRYNFVAMIFCDSFIDIKPPDVKDQEDKIVKEIEYKLMEIKKHHDYIDQLLLSFTDFNSSDVKDQIDKIVKGIENTLIEIRKHHDDTDQLENEIRK